MQLFEDLRNDVLDPKATISTILRRAKVLATLLKDTSLEAWVDGELNGYPPEAELPRYRVIASTLRGTFTGPFGGLAQNVVLPTIDLPAVFKPFIGPVEVRDPIRRIESLAEQGGMHRTWPAEVVILSRQYIQMSAHYVLASAWNPVDKSDLDAVLDAVRNALLGLLLKLEGLNPAVATSDAAFATIPKRDIAGIVNLSIYGNNNIVAGGTTVAQTVSVVASHDTATLITHFQALGVAKPDLEDLRTAVLEEPTPEGQALGPKTKSWMARMLTKAVEGTWKVTLETAPALIMQGLRQYYGWTA
jgi:hypothetical protein